MGIVPLMRPQGGSGGRLWATLGDEAAAAGVTVDLYLAAPTDGILATLRQLVDPTGGAISTTRLKPRRAIRRQRRRAMASPPTATAAPAELRHVTFADDVTANLHAPHASSGEMRLRCSPEFGVARAYGGIAEVVGGDGVYRVGGRRHRRRLRLRASRRRRALATTTEPAHFASRVLLRCVPSHR